MKKALIFFSLLVFIAFSSCEKTDLKKGDYDKGDYEKDKDWSEDKEKCFDLIYPLTYTMPDASTITGGNEEEVWAAMKVWYEANPNSEEKPVLEYPVEISYEEGETKEIGNENEMIKAKKDCYDKKGECFDLAYPITYTMPDGHTVSGDDKEELWLNIKAWYEANPDSEEKPILNYPVGITFGQEGETKTIENEEDMLLAKKACYNNKETCFDFVYPITFNMPDGSNVSGANTDDVWTAIKAWYETNPDSEEKPNLEYPVDIVFDSGETETINDDDEMILAKKACYDDKDDCFELAHPIIFTMPDGSTITGGDEEEVWTAMKAWYEVNLDIDEEATLNYPVDIVFDDGTVQAIADEAAMFLAKEECE